MLEHPRSLAQDRQRQRCAHWGCGREKLLRQAWALAEDIEAVVALYPVARC